MPEVLTRRSTSFQERRSITSPESATAAASGRLRIARMTKAAKIESRRLRTVNSFPCGLNEVTEAQKKSQERATLKPKRSAPNAIPTLNLLSPSK
jgi:hypothetical protein